MNKWQIRQIICPPIAALVVAIVFGSIHLRGERRYLEAAVTRQIDSHSTQIVSLLSNMPRTNVTLVEDAVFQELQRAPSTSLITRPMIRVATAGDGSLECVVDTSSLGVAVSTIRSSP
jgi:hypothetical protein